MAAKGESSFLFDHSIFDSQQFKEIEISKMNIRIQLFIIVILGSVNAKPRSIKSGIVFRDDISATTVNQHVRTTTEAPYTLDYWSKGSRTITASPDYLSTLRPTRRVSTTTYRPIISVKPNPKPNPSQCICAENKINCKCPFRYHSDCFCNILGVCICPRKNL